MCDACALTIRPAGELRTPGGLIVHPWALHEGVARTLVRRLKYEGVAAVAPLVAGFLEDRIPSDARCLVPVTRTVVRRVRYGIDPAKSLAEAISRRTGLPVVNALSPPIWNRPSAGSERESRKPPRFVSRRAVRGAVLVDDVLTTGATLDSAAAALGGVGAALTLTGVP
ncbi:MAG: hypothetical protein WD532_10270 [Acidimicrobiia bacterium]